MCTNWSGRSSAAAKDRTSSAVSRVWRRLLTNTRTGFSGECACDETKGVKFTIYRGFSIVGKLSIALRLILYKGNLGLVPFSFTKSSECRPLLAWWYAVHRQSTGTYIKKRASI